VERALLAEIYHALQKLIGLHRQLLEATRGEHQAIVEANLKGIQMATNMKQALVETIGQTESSRLKSTGQLAAVLGKNPAELTLKNIIQIAQDVDRAVSDSLRTSYNVLNLLIQRITEQNQSNKILIENSLAHMQKLRGNALTEASSASVTYTQQGEKSVNVKSSHLISREA